MVCRNQSRDLWRLKRRSSASSPDPGRSSPQTRQCSRCRSSYPAARARVIAARARDDCARRLPERRRRISRARQFATRPRLRGACLRTKPRPLFHRKKFREREWPQDNCRAGAPPAKCGKRCACPTKLFLGRFALSRVLLGVNHHAFERVDRTQHLRIVALDKILVLVGPNRVTTAASGKKQALLLRTHRDADVWSDTVTMNHLFARCVIFRGRET